MEHISNFPSFTHNHAQPEPNLVAAAFAKEAQKLSKLPRNSAKTRVRNRCQITGRPHGVYRKLKISRIALRQLGLEGKIPGMVKSSW